MKAVITCGGTGSRLFPFSKELPKEMAPVFYRSKNGLQLVPLIQIIFERLYDVGIREFCFIIGKNKKAIEDHFIPSDYDSMEFLNKLKSSKIFWITQNNPKGFGDAVRYAESFINKEKFILQAGDVATLNKENTILKKLAQFSTNDEYNHVLVARKVKDPERHGILTVRNYQNLSEVLSAIEKPKDPKSNLGIMPIYLLNYDIFKNLKKISAGVNNEIQLTDAIQMSIEQGKKVVAIMAENEEFWDVGTPDSYWNAINNSYVYDEV